MKLRSLQTNLVPMGQLREQLQVHCMTSYLVDGRVPGQSGRRPALCRSRFLIVVFYLPWLPYSGMNLVTRSSMASFPASKRCMMQVSVVVVLVTEAMSKMVSLLKKGLLKGSSLWERCPKGRLQIVLVPFETRRMPPANAPFMRQRLTVSQTGVQSQAWADERDMPITITIKSRINQYNNQIPSVSIMKALSNSQPEGKNQVEHPEQLHKRLAELRQTNSQKETLISKLEQEVKGLEETNAALKEERQAQESLWEEVRAKEEEKEEEDEHEMQEWIEQVQKQNGLSQEALDSLLSLEFEGGQQEICPACYQELQAGAMCTYLPCAHLFHRDCIVNHLRVNRFCLACQEEVVL